MKLNVACETMPSLVRCRESKISWSSLQFNLGERLIKIHYHFSQRGQPTKGQYLKILREFGVASFFPRYEFITNWSK